jgi:hypothetical protein
MGRKFKCDSSSSSSSSSCSSSCSSSSFIYCCNKYPKCKCAPIYYPEKYSPYPCNPCNPCNPLNPYKSNYCSPNPYSPYVCPSNPCTQAYTVNTTINTSSTALAVSSPTINVFNMSESSQTITLPAISTLSSCNYTKQFIIANQVGATHSFSIVQTSPDSLISSSITLSAGNTVTLYAVYVSGGTSFWVAQV